MGDKEALQKNFQEEKSLLIEDLNFLISYLEDKASKTPAKIDQHHATELFQISAAITEFAAKYRENSSGFFDITKLMKDIVNKQQDRG